MVNPKLTENFLLAQDNVLDASVWYDGSGLRAHVTPSPGVNMSAHDLRGICAAVIGVENTPDDIVFIDPRRHRFH